MENKWTDKEMEIFAILRGEKEMVAPKATKKATKKDEDRATQFLQSIPKTEIFYRPNSLELEDLHKEVIGKYLQDVTIQRWASSPSLVALYINNKMAVEIVASKSFRISLANRYSAIGEGYELRKSGYSVDYTKKLDNADELKKELGRIMGIIMKEVA